MHIADGVLPWTVLAGGGALTAAGTALGLRKLDYDRIMTVSLLAAAFFVASLIHMPIGPSSVHLVLCGLLGLLLGWGAFPAILAALTLQAVLFGYGGVTVLGVNTFNMAAPGVVCFYLFRPLIRRGGATRLVGSFLAGSVAVALAGILTALSLAVTEGFLGIAGTILASHGVIIPTEGLVTLFVVEFLSKVKPEALEHATAH